MGTAKPEDISMVNKAAIIDLLKENESLSRADITRALGMSFPSVSINIKQLIEDGFVVEVGEGSGKDGLGRKSTLLSFNENRGYVVGVFFNINRMIISCANLLGIEICAIEKKMDLGEDGEYAYNLMKDTIYEVLENSNVSKDKLECICVGLPGIYDPIIQKSSYVPFLLSWEEIPIETRLKEEFIDNIVIENVVNLGLVGEKWRGNAQKYNDIVYIDYELGISSGIMINGEVYKGYKGLSGEVGFMLLDPIKIREPHSVSGDLEEKVSGVSISRYEEEVFGDVDVQYSLINLIRHAKSGDVKAKEYVDMILTHISVALVNITAVLNPEVIILSGENGNLLFYEYEDEIKSILSSNVPSLPQLVSSKYTGIQTGINGAIYVAVNNAASNIENVARISNS